MQKQLTMQEMLPEKYEPKVNRRFILNMDGIDAYIVKSVHTPPLVPNKVGKLIPKKFHLLRIFLYCPIAPSTEQMVSEVLEKQSKNGNLEPIELRYLDPVGTIVALWKFAGAKIEEVKFSNPDYNNNELMECELLVSFDSLDVIY